MKTIGLLGGMSWESTVTYYQIINEEVKKRLGGLHSAPCIIYSVDFAEIEHYQQTGDWDQAARVLSEAAQRLVKVGADCIVIATNTMHKVFDQIQAGLPVPLLHIAAATAEEIRARRIGAIGLLGTKYTMEQDFYRSRLEMAGLTVLVPGPAERRIVNDVIYQELCLGVVSQESKREYLRIMRQLQSAGAEGIILGCTEIGLLVNQDDIEIPLFDTTLIHARKAVAFAMQGSVSS